MPITNLNFADGQVAATATQICVGPSEDAQTLGRLLATFCNTGTDTETLVLTVSRNGGTARRLYRCTLDPDEQLIVNGLPLNRTDSFLASTTNAGVVDYVVAIAPQDTPFSVQVFDDDGSPRPGTTLGDLIAIE